MNDLRTIDELVLDHLLQNNPSPMAKPFYSQLIADYGKEKVSNAVRSMEIDGLITPCTMRTLTGYFVANYKARLTQRGEQVTKAWRDQQ